MAIELVRLISRVNYNVKFVYEGVTFVLSPKQKTKKEFLREKLVDIDTNEIMIVR